MLENSFEVNSFLEDQEIEILLKFYGSLPKTLNKGDLKKAYTTGFPIETIPIKKFKTRLREVFGDFNVTISMFLEEFIPWSVHSDYPKGDKTPYYAVLIPLSYDDKDTHTVIFNELGVDNDWKDQLIVQAKHEYSDQQSKLLSHIDNDLLDKLSVDKFYKWQKGNIIAWHRNLLHTSDNFALEGLKKKTALVLFLNRDD